MCSQVVVTHDIRINCLVSICGESHSFLFVCLFVDTLKTAAYRLHLKVTSVLALCFLVYAKSLGRWLIYSY